MSCNCCNCSLINGFYKCDINDYRIVDESDKVADMQKLAKAKYRQRLRETSHKQGSE